VLVAVTDALQAVHDVHGADVDHVPLVQPGQSDLGHEFSFHQLVQGPAVHDPPEVHGPDCPHPPAPAPPNGPPLPGPQPPFPEPKPNPPVNWVDQLPVGVPVPHGPDEILWADVKEDQSPEDGPLG